MVAGQRTGKTSFLRLLLDTSEVSRTATKDQLASVAKFVQGCSGHTTHIRTASIDIDLDGEGKGPVQPLTLTLVDTPSLDFEDETSSERAVAEILRHVETRFVEGVDEEWKPHGGNRYVHLCIYFLDPDDIVPPMASGSLAPLVSRSRANSSNQSETEPVILEPPVTTNPLLCRPTLRSSQINAIRRLSARVNVLPVVARADTLTNDRLAAVKLAVRRDLADAGIGFGIFDTEGHATIADSTAATPNREAVNGYPHGSASSPRGSPTSPKNPPYLRLPYALISPDTYSHSDGVPRTIPPRHELIHQYTPSNHHSKFIPGKFTRSYRWGSMDVLDPSHSDFLALRTAVFHHMDTLQKYTKEYLFDKFRAEYLGQHHQRMPAPIHSLHASQQGMVARSHLPPLTIARPVLAIDTVHHTTPTRHAPPPMSARDLGPRELISTTPLHSAHPDGYVSNSGARLSPANSRSSKQRTKKITVACNFCRSRKLKCDGGRPACAQCLKRSNACDYQPQNNKRRGVHRQRRQGDDSDSDMGSAEEPSGENSLSPEVSSHSVSRKSSNVGRAQDARAPDPRPPDRSLNSHTLDAFSPAIADDHLYHHMPRNPGYMSATTENRSLFRDNELPHIASLSLPSSDSNMQGLLPPIRPASEQGGQSRKRASTVPGRSRAASNTGPKVVACNFCRARKTKCDGMIPQCASCSRRSLPCNYNHDPSTSSRKKGPRAPPSTMSGLTPSPPSNSPPVSPSVMQSTRPGSREAQLPHSSTSADGSESAGELKRKIDDPEPMHFPKRPRTDGSSTGEDIP
ncbi:hypothetical protein FIBSPDRAFT_721126 [Athelia psychrophila]|uniref:Zn(2)-C6 fungal-type domain-containing protein n=1 Tax=Athelia psychrophila TaxID=1759441 RepID=A0A166WEN1_9AGAM|nr:hypothetical protein FIBSPDRAFT_721126 [Fibularhizoctonia sp. CBS 109695]